MGRYFDTKEQAEAGLMVIQEERGADELNLYDVMGARVFKTNANKDDDHIKRIWSRYGQYSLNRFVDRLMDMRPKNPLAFFLRVRVVSTDYWQPRHGLPRFKDRETGVLYRNNPKGRYFVGDYFEIVSEQGFYSGCHRKMEFAARLLDSGLSSSSEIMAELVFALAEEIGRMYKDFEEMACEFDSKVVRVGAVKKISGIILKRAGRAGGDHIAFDISDPVIAKNNITETAKVVDKIPGHDDNEKFVILRMRVKTYKYRRISYISRYGTYRGITRHLPEGADVKHIGGGWHDVRLLSTDARDMGFI